MVQSYCLQGRGGGGRDGACRELHSRVCGGRGLKSAQWPLQCWFVFCILLLYGMQAVSRLAAVCFLVSLGRGAVTWLLGSRPGNFKVSTIVR